jgi:2-oxoglutarate dehydrogenase E2 component (dihydrolipoamide succinyltransferase)
MRANAISHATLRWIAAAGAAGAFVATLSVQTVRGDTPVTATPRAGIESAISDSTPGSVSTGDGRLVAVSVPALRLPPRPAHKAHRRAAPPAPASAPQLVDAPVATPTPAPAPAPAAPPAPVVQPVVTAPPPPAPPKPKPPSRGPGFDSSG